MIVNQQFHSPYLANFNNPSNFVDPSGGWGECFWEAAEAFFKNTNGSVGTSGFATGVAVVQTGVTAVMAVRNIKNIPKRLMESLTDNIGAMNSDGWVPESGNDGVYTWVEGQGLESVLGVDNEGFPVHYKSDGTTERIRQQTSDMEKVSQREVSWWKDIDWNAVGHGVLDIVGMIPVLGEVADLANAAWYAAEGDLTNAAICVAAMVPIAGIGVIGAKIANNGFKAWRKSKQVKKAIDVTADNSVKQSSKSIADNLPAPGCFVAGTLVWSADSLIRIEDIEIGDSVYAYNTTSNSLSIQVVREAYVRTVNKLVRLTTNTETIYTTVEHPFYVNNGWVNASHLHAGDTLFSATSAIIIVNSIFFIDTLVNVYNFTVETDHDYFVGESGVLVHNNPCDNLANNFGKFLDADELAKRLGTTVADYHKNIKPLMKKDFAAEMKKIGTTNPDFSPDALGNVMLKNPQTGKVITTNTPFDLYKQ